jgi:hypothetical protein
MRGKDTIEVTLKISYAIFPRLVRPYFVAFLAQASLGYARQKASRLAEQYLKIHQNLF